MKRRTHLAIAVTAIFALGAGAALLPFLGASPYLTTLVYYMAFYLALGQAWNMMSGLTGYVSFAHGALAGVGAYAAVIALNAGWPLMAGLAVAVVASLLASLLISATSFRLRGVAFTFATLFFQELALLFTRKLEVTGGAGGLVLQDILPVWLPHTLMVATATGATIAMLFLLNSRAGIRLLAIKDDEDAAAAIGIEAAPRKVIVFCASAAICGLVGAIHALFTSSLYPEIVFQVDLSLIALAVPLIGGVGTAFGPVLGALLYMGARETLQIVAPSLHLIIVGLLILLVTLFMRAGLGPELLRLMRRMRGRELKVAASPQKEVCR